MSHTFQSLQVGKAASLRYVRELLARLDDVNDPKAECLHESMTGHNLKLFVQEGDPHNVPFTHCLRVVYIVLHNVYTEDVNDCVHALKKNLRDDEWADTDTVRVYKGSKVVDDVINLKAYLHDDKAAKHDVSYLKFKYNPVYGMWMDVDSDDSIDDGIILVSLLDFSEVGL
jgi:hypothetical protein